MKSLSLTREQMNARKLRFYHTRYKPKRQVYDQRPEVQERHRKNKRRLYHENPRYRATQKAYRRRPENIARRLGCEVPTRRRPKRCELCRRVPAKGTLRLDHAHESGKFRGWICGSCNLVLGGVKDSPALLRKMADYLERTK